MTITLEAPATIRTVTTARSASGSGMTSREVSVVLAKLGTIRAFIEDMGCRLDELEKEITARSATRTVAV